MKNNDSTSLSYLKKYQSFIEFNYQFFQEYALKWLFFLVWSTHYTKNGEIQGGAGGGKEKFNRRVFKE